jgi:hypothetical protein
VHLQLLPQTLRKKTSLQVATLLFADDRLLAKEKKISSQNADSTPASVDDATKE